MLPSGNHTDSGHHNRPLSFLSKRSSDRIKVPSILNESISIIRTSTVPSFLFSYVDHVEKPYWVDENMRDHRRVYPVVTELHRLTLENQCRSSPNGALMVDVGCSMAYFSMFAAAHGCRVICVEPQEFKHSYIDFHIHINNFDDRIQLFRGVLTTIKDDFVHMEKVSHARHGSAKLRTGGSDNNVKTMRLDELVKEDVGVIKIDVEGHEWEVIQSGLALFENYNVQFLIVEFVVHRLRQKGNSMLKWAHANNYYVYEPPRDWPPNFSFALSSVNQLKLLSISNDEDIAATMENLSRYNSEHNLLFSKVPASELALDNGT